MPRETNKQRREREAIEQGQRLAQKQEEYPLKLMTTLDRARAENFELEVRGNWFQVEDRDDRHAGVYRLTYGYTDQAWDALEELEHVVAWKRTEREDRLRTAELRKAVIERLTPEERVACNLAG